MHIYSILTCVFSGMCMGGAWWVYGDGVITFKQTIQFATTPYRGYWIVPGLIATISMIALNIGVTPHTVKEQWQARLWMFIWLTVGFVSIGVAIWIMSTDNLIGDGTNWTGISLLVQSLLALTSGVSFFLRNGTE